MSNWAEITDSEREAAVRDLTRHCGDGRLTLDELEGRVEEVYAATTRAELRLALRELPRFRDEPAVPRHASPDRSTAGHAPGHAPHRRARTAPARCCGAPVVGSSAAILLTLVTVLFVTSHHLLAVVLLLLWLPRARARRRAPVLA
jgi:hypothetical protein